MSSDLKQSDPYGWNALYAPKVTEIKSTYQQQVEALKEQERQLRLKAEQDARAQAQATVQSAIDSVMKKNEPLIAKYQDNIAQVNNMLAGKVGEIVLTYPGYGTENWKRGELDEENLRQILAGNERSIAELSDPQAARDQAFRQVVKNNPDVFVGDVWDNYAFWGQLAGQTIPLDNMQQILVDNLTAPAVGQLQEQYARPIYLEVEKLTRSYDSNLAAVNQDYARHKDEVRDDMRAGIAPPFYQTSDPPPAPAAAESSKASGSAQNSSSPTPLAETQSATPFTSGQSLTPTLPQNFYTPSTPKVVNAPSRQTADLAAKARVVEANEQSRFMQAAPSGATPASGLIGGAGLLSYTPTMNAPANNVGLLMNQNPQLYNLNAPGVRLPGQGV